MDPLRWFSAYPSADCMSTIITGFPLSSHDFNISGLKKPWAKAALNSMKKIKLKNTHVRIFSLLDPGFLHTIYLIQN
jgi:hypothetical protein